MSIKHFSITTLLALLVGGVVGFQIGSARNISDFPTSSEDPSIRGTQDEPGVRALPPNSGTQAGKPGPLLEEPERQGNFKDWQAQLIAQLMEERIAKTSETGAEDLNYIFQRAGLDPDTSARFQKYLAELHRHAIFAGDAIQELMTQRWQFDLDARMHMTPEGYEQWLEFERTTPAIREFQRMQDYAARTHGESLSPEYANLVVPLIRELNATTTETWHRPYDPYPRPAVGPDAVIARLQEQIARVREQYPELVRAVEPQHLPGEVLSLLTQYYESVVAGWEEQIAHAQTVQEMFLKGEISARGRP